MVKIHVERTIDLPLSEAWPILADFSNVHKIHPLVGKVDQLSSNDRGLDAKRTCHLYQGGTATERVVNWDENMHEYTIKLLEGTLPMKSVEATLRAAVSTEGKTKLTADMEAVAKYGLLGKIMEHLVMKKQFGKALGNLFAGIEHYAKTGKEVKQGFKANTPAIVK